jgi:hypothetical protein
MGMSEGAGGGRIGRGPIPAETGSEAEEPQPARAQETMAASIRLGRRRRDMTVDLME